MVGSRSGNDTTGAAAGGAGYTATGAAGTSDGYTASSASTAERRLNQHPLNKQQNPQSRLLQLLNQLLLTTGSTASNCCLRISLRIYTSDATGSESTGSGTNSFCFCFFVFISTYIRKSGNSVRKVTLQLMHYLLLQTIGK